MRDCRILNSEMREASAVKSKIWGPGTIIGVQNLNVPIEIWGSFVIAASEWEQYGNIKFDFNGGNRWVRVQYIEGTGSNSAIGRDCLNFDPATATMTLGWVEDGMFKHEMGHVLGLEHVTLAADFPYHFKIPETIKYFHDNYGWTAEETYREVITKMGGERVIENDWEQGQIMAYYFPKELIVEGVDVTPGTEISESEKALIGLLYPRG